ncbi:hypothetical protein ACFL1H_06955 [Nanoarchaeota archaeon]
MKCDHNKKIKIMADYSTKGLWCGECGGHIDPIILMTYRNVRITMSLSDKLKEFNDYFEENADYISPVGCQAPDPIPSFIDTLNDLGRIIEKELQKLNPNFEVYYHPYTYAER